MANLTLNLSSFEDFVSQVTPSEETTARDVELLKREVELYLRRLRQALKADLEQICENCCPGSPE